MKLDTYRSLNINYRHQIAYAKFNLKIYYQPPNEREKYHYQEASTDHIRKAIKTFLRNRPFKSLSGNKIVFSFNKTIFPTTFSTKL